MSAATSNASSRDGREKGAEETNTSLRDETVLEVERVPSVWKGPKFPGGTKLKLKAAWRFLNSDVGHNLIRSFLCLSVPSVVYYIPHVREELGRMAFLLPLFACVLGVFALPTYVGVCVSLALKLLISIAFGQAYAFFVVWIAADLWPVLTLLLFIEAFLSSSLLLRDLQWGISMCLGELSNVARPASSSSCADRDTLKTAGTICSFFLLK